MVKGKRKMWVHGRERYLVGQDCGLMQADTLERGQHGGGNRVIAGFDEARHGLDNFKRNGAGLVGLEESFHAAAGDGDKLGG